MPVSTESPAPSQSPLAEQLPIDDLEVVDPAEGFGQLWHKRYSVVLRGCEMDPASIIRFWRDHFGEFWPGDNQFHQPLSGIQPNEVAVSELEMPAGTTLTTGIIVGEVTPTSFTFKTPKGHTFAGRIRFQAGKADGAPIAGVDIVMRASDPIFELSLPLGGHRKEDAFWHDTLTNLARALGSNATPTQQHTLVDTHRRWRNATNIRHNGLVLSAIAAVRKAIGRITTRSNGKRTSS